jgi:hypothetical protein
VSFEYLIIMQRLEATDCLRSNSAMRRNTNGQQAPYLLILRKSSVDLPLNIGPTIIWIAPSSKPAAPIDEKFVALSKQRLLLP